MSDRQAAYMTPLVERPPADDDYIHANVLTVEQLFGRNRSFHLPWFQRSYAWREAQVARLMSDLLGAMQSPKQRYSLGQVRFGGSVKEGNGALIDGHQRAITLTMFFAVLRDQLVRSDQPTSLLAAFYYQRLHALIAAPSGLGSPWRLTPQTQVADFFEQYVQTEGGTLLDPADGPDDITPAERHLLANRNQLRSSLSTEHLDPVTPYALIEFVLTRCFLLSVEVDDEHEAWSMLGLEQSMRLPHDVCEQSKSTMIYVMKAHEHDQATQVWERAQGQLGSDGIAELLQHLRSIKLIKRSTKPLDAELQELYELDRNGLGFMQGTFQPHAESMIALSQRTVGVGPAHELITQYINQLDWLDHRQWVAPAIVWLTTKTASHPDTVEFFKHLDRLAWMLRIAGTDPNEQENRFIRACAAAARVEPIGSCDEFVLDSKTITDALVILRSRTFYLKHMSNRVLRRLCAELGTDPGSIDGVHVSVEHILPRRPSRDKRWWLDFNSDAAVHDHTDRLGNLALLTGPQNRAADRSDWEIKREILKASAFSLSNEAATNARWTKRTINARTETLIKVLLKPWGITSA